MTTEATLARVAKLIGRTARAEGDGFRLYEGNIGSHWLDADQMCGMLLDALVERGGYAMSEGEPCGGVTILHLTVSGQGPTRIEALLALAEKLP